MKINFIFCNGYHFHDDVQKSLITGIAPTSTFYPSTTDDIAKKEGWIAVENVRFSSDKSLVWLCPECAKRWQVERNGQINNILKSKKELFIEYLKTTSKDYHALIINKYLSNLRQEFINLAPTVDEWEQWNDIEKGYCE